MPERPELPLCPMLMGYNPRWTPRAPVLIQRMPLPGTSRLQRETRVKVTFAMARAARAGKTPMPGSWADRLHRKYAGQRTTNVQVAREHGFDSTHAAAHMRELATFDLATKVARGVWQIAPLR